MARRGNPNLVKGVSGNPNGRPKGHKNKFTNLKDAFIGAFKELGGKQAITEWLTADNIEIKNKKGKVIRVIDLRGDRREKFFQMISKMLPADIHVSDAEGKPLIPSKIEVVPVKLKDDK